MVVDRNNNQEWIVSAQPGGNGLVVATSSGRIFTLNLESGQIMWQVRPQDHAADQLAVNPHFTVVRMDDPGGSQVRAYDTSTGRVIGVRRFGADNTPGQLVNVALSEEGTLAFTLFNRVLVKDLYDPWKVAPSELRAQANSDQAPFVGLNLPDQLIIQGGRLACLYDGSSYARAYDLSKNIDPTNPLSTEANSNATGLRMVGSRLFVVTGRKIKQFNLSDIADTYPGDTDEGFPPKVRAMFLGKDYVVVINDTVDRGPAGSPYEVIMAFSRALVKSNKHESGVLGWDPKCRSATGILDWLPAEGGLYYLEKNNTASFLRGARQSPATQP